MEGFGIVFSQISSGSHTEIRKETTPKYQYPETLVNLFLSLSLSVSVW
jgi:hypothetical protein